MHMYDSQPREREGEDIEQVLPSAIQTTSTTGRGPMPLRSFRSVREAARGSHGNMIRAIIVLAAVCVLQTIALLGFVIF